jgi:hypothetical protein
VDGLGELAEMGMTLCRAIIRQGVDADATPAVRSDVDLAFSRVSVAVRRTVALRDRLVTELDALEHVAAQRALKAERDQDYLDEAAETVSRERVKRVIEADRQDDRDAERLCEDADIHGDLADRPFSEIVAQICQDLGVTPDRPRLAQEAWAREELEHGPVGAPLALWMAARDAADPPPPPSSSGSSQGPSREDLAAALFDTT